ncbi:MAG: hypothetical protein QOD06_3380 [Candidatus Binatota bacterium]|nr:hypothetical protein [Candidatus Binatota bacterium]
MRGATRSSPARGRPRRGAYHHGRLREALIAGAIDLLSTRGTQGLTLREAARKAGVSHSAPYRHFANKESLLAAVSEDGFRRLIDAGITAAAGERDPARKLRVVGISYVRFAAENPALFRLMFGAEVSGERHPSLREQARRGFSLLGSAVAEAQAAGVLRAGSPVELAMPIWVLAHGLAMLTIDRQVPAELREQVAIEPLADWLMSVLLAGLDAGGRFTH